MLAEARQHQAIEIELHRIGIKVVKCRGLVLQHNVADQIAAICLKMQHSTRPKCVKDNTKMCRTQNGLVRMRSSGCIDRQHSSPDKV